ncbi:MULTISPECIES: hypothetical protein [unclassified Streptomyces]|uniref:hypothetical protein n=1 Tax=unclassified Streptomyces TaxID=2593676 RepID=UPI0033D273E6
MLGPGGEPATREAIGAALSRAGREATELLLVYYSGHGLVDDDGMLHLALEHTAGVAVAGGLPWQHPRDERPTEGERTPTSSATTGHGPGTRPTSTASGASPSSRPPRPTTEELKVELFKSNRTSDGTVTIDLKGAVGAVDRGKVSEVFGGGEGQTGGGGGVRADNTNGGTASGFVNFAVDALGRTCSAHGLALGESTLVTGPTHKWAKITVVHVENATPDNSKDITATFRISQGRGETVPKD